MFADKPGFVARQMLLALIPDPLRWSIGLRAVRPSRDGSFASFRARAGYLPVYPKLGTYCCAA